MDDNDLDEMPDFDASVSTINSDCERVDSVLIKKILSEMKSEFTRGTAGSVNESEEKCDSFDESPELYEVEKKGNSIQNNISGVNATEDSESRDSNTQDESNENSVVESKTPDDTEDSPRAEKPRIILTLRTNEEDRENGTKFIKSNQVSSENLSDISDNSSVINHSNDVCSQPETPVVDCKQTLLEGRTKRNLRSRYSNPEKDVEQSGLKRSSRRFSKEYGRESVLQNAIARKEKSFNSLNPSEERSYRRGARSPRHSYIPNEVKQTKSSRTKSPKQLAVEKAKTQNCSTSESSTPASTPVCSENERPDSATTLDSNKETDLLLDRLKNETEALTDDSNENINVNRRNEVGLTSDNEKTPTKVKNNPLYYTKTGKRRSRYFKGLKYSLTGGSVRKKALALARRGLRKTVAAKENPPEVKEEPPQPTQEEEEEEEPHEAEMPAEEALDTNGEKRSPSPAIAEACHSNVLKRKSQPDFSDSEDVVAEKRVCEDVAVPSSEDTEPDVEPEKQNCEDVSSPNTGEVESSLVKPESTIIAAGVGTAGLCYCNNLVEIYASPASCRTELYCQAVDSLDGRLIGCCNTVDKSNARLVRPSITVPYLVLCEVHHQRLQRHNCCPGCGNFCTQGKFMQCWAYHHYHKDCQLMEDDKPACPHCGTDSALEVNISLGAHKYPVFLPLQKPSKELPSAKMSFSGVKILEASERPSSPPLIPPAALLLPSGLQISAEGLPPSIDKDKLENLLHVACSINSDSAPQPRYGIRNMYQAAKAGDAEKMIYMLASGLNPNHIFREWGMGSSLHAASSCGHLAVVHLLVQAGANTDILDREQNTPLMLAASNGHNEIVKYLVKAGASVTFKGGDGMTALHLAAKSGNVEACYYLVSNPNTPHSYIDTVDDGRWTPLVWAAEHCHTEVVRFLLERRADPLVRDAEQNIALHWAALAGSVDIAEALLNYGSDVNSTNAHGDTPLHIAARQNAYGCAVLLLARGARVDVHNRAGFTPLDCCIVSPSDTYTAIKLNVELRALTLSVNKRSNRILTNDITRGYEANPIQCINSVDEESEPQDFVYITENCFTSNISIDRTITSLQSCKCRDMCSGGGCMCGKISIRCWYDDDGKLLPDFNFADPPMLFECNQACTCNRLMCKNRVVQHGITARFQLFRTKGNKGWGVSTLRLIPKGAYVCEYIGEIISDCEADTREDDSYLFDLDNRDGETYCIDARRYGNIARFINHSCVPNLLPVRVFIDHQDLHFPRIAFFANRDIQANEELGFDYGEKFWIIKYKSFTCTCGSESCRYSENTIEQTLDNYNKKLQQEESP